MVVLPYSVIYYIYILGTLGPCFNYLCLVCWCSGYGICKRSDTLWPAGRVRLFADYTISLSSLCRLIWRHWPNKKRLSGICCRVCVQDWDYSRNYLSFNIWDSVSSAYPIRLSWLWECVLYLIIIIESEVWIINHCLGLGHETMACAVYLTMFLCCRNLTSRWWVWSGLKSVYSVVPSIYRSLY